MKPGDKVIRIRPHMKHYIQDLPDSLIKNRPGPDLNEICSIESVEGDYISLKEWPSRDSEIHPWYKGNFKKI